MCVGGMILVGVIVVDSTRKGKVSSSTHSFRHATLNHRRAQGLRCVCSLATELPRRTYVHCAHLVCGHQRHRTRGAVGLSPAVGASNTDVACSAGSHRHRGVASVVRHWCSHPCDTGCRHAAAGAVLGMQRRRCSAWPDAGSRPFSSWWKDHHRRRQFSYTSRRRAVSARVVCLGVQAPVDRGVCSPSRVQQV